MKQISYDVAVIGGGPVGYAAALYCARSGFSVIVLEQLSREDRWQPPDRWIIIPVLRRGLTALNWEKMQKGAERFGAETAFVSVKSAELTGDIKKSPPQRERSRPER